MTAPTELPGYDVARTAYMRVRRIATDVLLERRLGIETSREVDLATLGLAARDRGDYEAVRLDGDPPALGTQPIHPDDVFLDLGSGKGRVVLEAARRPFRRVIGVEISPELNAIAARNLEASRRRLRAQDVRFITADANAHSRSPTTSRSSTSATRLAARSSRPRWSSWSRPWTAGSRPVRVSYQFAREHDRLMATGRFRFVGRRDYGGRRAPGSATPRSTSMSCFRLPREPVMGDRGLIAGEQPVDAERHLATLRRHLPTILLVALAFAVLVFLLSKSMPELRRDHIDRAAGARRRREPAMPRPRAGTSPRRAPSSPRRRSSTRRRSASASRPRRRRTR